MENKHVLPSSVRIDEILDSIVETVIVTDVKGKITYVNKSVENFLDFDYTQDEIVGQSFAKFASADSLANATKIIFEALSGDSKNENKVIKLSIRAKSGLSIPVEVKGHILREEGKVVGVQVVIRDVRS